MRTTMPARCMMTAMVLMMLGIAWPALAQTTRTWTVGDGDWDHANDNWSGQVFADGDIASFGAASANRNRENQIFIGTSGVPAPVAPVELRTSGGYTASFAFLGGDITDDGATPAVIKPGLSNPVYFRRAGSYTFSGGIESLSTVYYLPAVTSPNQTLQLGTGPIHTPGFEFAPADAGTKLDNTITIFNTRTESNTPRNWYGNSNADWSLTTVNLHGGQLDVGEQTVNDYTGLTFNLVSNMTFRLDHRSSNPFYPHIQGPAILSLFVNTGYNGRARVTGAGNWSIGGTTKRGPGQLDIEAPEIFGDVLRIEQGTLRLLAAGQPQTVKEVWLGAVRHTTPGTYGHSSSGADFPDDTYFANATGVISIPPPRGTVFLLR